jgi:uncharacterized protein (TIGR02646 family)
VIRLRRPLIKDVLPNEAHRAKFDARRRFAAGLQSGASNIDSSWDSFRAGRGSNRDVGPRVVQAVTGMAHGKCAYCESGRPATVDHFWPKKLYPKRLFDLDNLLPACRDCNTGKLADFPLTGDAPVLLHPVDDEPLGHLRWDGLTGRCLYASGDTRAEETVRAFELDVHATERLHKWTRVRTLLGRCAAGAPVPREVADPLRGELLAERPYLCIVRSHLLYPVAGERLLVKAAVRALPDIVAWVAPWIEVPAGVSWPLS